MPRKQYLIAAAVAVSSGLLLAPSAVQGTTGDADAWNQWASASFQDVAIG